MCTRCIARDWDARSPAFRIPASTRNASAPNVRTPSGPSTWAIARTIPRRIWGIANGVRWRSSFKRAPAAYGLTVDISLDPKDRFDETAWAAFLNRCKGQLGTEAGGDYFDLDDRSRHEVNAYVADHPGASFEEIRARFFDQYPNPVPLRILSGRNVEAAGTKTAQLLFDGHYDGFFVADQHYIALRKDFSNADEALAKFRDEEFRHRISEQAYDLVCREFTYERLMDRVHDAVKVLN